MDPAAAAVPATHEYAGAGKHGLICRLTVKCAG